MLTLAHAERRILITDDRDFGELVFRYLQPHTGMIYFRLDNTVLGVRLTRLQDVLASHADQLDQFLIVTLRQIRVRGS